ncbi:tRNA (guanosine(37)-N1)-methyltransferase TrmD [Rarobacter incanus]|uniref:tRNA (guanine-N(1)-)-methyltransferase n=1 Tax=Rarobacter incanus TaxID=153494 RepID=A0A542SME1_9MICO|nr:tRNA (guanosine(37)-N1)-methyltransferase TrmD [Rarobacter incanus]TQK75417.1 tRNA (guanine37-N1)-methyltransferase [Rarobacter incanus]
MKIDVISIFPAYLDALKLSLVGKAQESGLLDVNVRDLRDWTTDRHRTVDDTPTGGGAGMVMKPDVWGNALDDVLQRESTLVIPTPSGEVFTQALAARLAQRPHLVFACGRYEGIDARVAQHYRAAGIATVEASIGDYVLNGGEVAALVMIEAVARLIPGMVGNPESLVEESHGEAGLLEYPVYTKPVSWRGIEIPAPLLSGHHANIARWRRDRALEKTAAIRPDMLAALRDRGGLSQTDEAVVRAADEVLRAGGVPATEGEGGADFS